MSDLYEIVYYPADILKVQSKFFIQDIAKDDKLQVFIQKLHDTMKAFNGVGLSAIQVGVPLALFVLNVDGPETIINPIILKTEGASYEKEGCLSVPGVFERIQRPASCEVSFFNEKGDKVNKTYTDLKARAFMHEYDHLMGKTFFDRMNFVQKESAQKKLSKIKKKYLK